MCESAALSFLIGAASGAISSSSGRRSRTRLAFSRRTSSQPGRQAAVATALAPSASCAALIPPGRDRSRPALWQVLREPNRQARVALRRRERDWTNRVSRDSTAVRMAQKATRACPTGGPVQSCERAAGSGRALLVLERTRGEQQWAARREHGKPTRASSAKVRRAAPRNQTKVRGAPQEYRNPASGWECPAKNRNLSARERWKIRTARESLASTKPDQEPKP